MKKHLYYLHALSQSGDDFSFGDFSPFAEFGFSIAGNLSIFHENLGHGTAVSDAVAFSSLINFNVFGVYFKRDHGVCILDAKVTIFVATVK